MLASESESYSAMDASVDCKNKKQNMCSKKIIQI